MKHPFLFSLASLESPSSPASGETVVKILHVNPVPEVLEIWQAAATEYEKAHPALLSWTSFTLNFVIRNPHRPSALSRMQRFLGMIVAEGELTSGRPQRSTSTLNAVRLVLPPKLLSPARS